MEQLNKRPQIHLRPSLHTYSFHNFLHSGQARWPTVFVQAGCIGRRSSVSARLCTRILTPNLAHTPHQPLPKLHLCHYQWRGMWEHRQQASRINVNRISLIDMTKGRIDSMPGARAPSAISTTRPGSRASQKCSFGPRLGLLCSDKRTDTPPTEQSWVGFHAMHRSRPSSTSHGGERRCRLATGFQATQGHVRFPPFTTPSPFFSRLL
jgi:hypothetical protein